MTERRPRVVDFSTHISGPMASRYLVHFGADVIKVEDPTHGDGNRGFPPLAHGNGVQHLSLNPGTRSLALDRSSPRWPDVTQALARWADVVIVGNRPSTASRLCIDFATMHRHNPNLIYCLISGYGLGGEWASAGAHGLNMDALAGAIALDWKAGVPEIPIGYRSAGTTLAGIHAALGIYAALYQGGSSSAGQLVHVSIWESALSWMWRDTTTQANTGHAWPAYQDLGSRYAVYAAGDDRAILVCPIEQRFWERFCDVTGLPMDLRRRGDWRGGADAGADYVALGERELVQLQLRQRPRDEWLAEFRRIDVPAAPVLDWREAMASDHAQANGAMAAYSLGDAIVQTPTVPISVTSSRSVKDAAAWHAAHASKGQSIAPPPPLGADTDAILRELGITQ